MHILYVHQNYPAQFGHIADALVAKGWRCTFVSQTEPGVVNGVQKFQYRLQGGATDRTHFCSRTFENAVWHSDAVYQTARDIHELEPDLIVGHSGFGSTLFLRELFPRVPVVNLFEFYYRSHDPDSDMDARRDLGWGATPIHYMRSYARNAMILLDLQNCQFGYTPTRFQRSRFPAEYQPKLRTVFDGIDRSIYHGHGDTLRPPVSTRQTRTVGGVEIHPHHRVVTYVSRGFESMRGFDIFMRAAKIIAEQNADVQFLIVGSDKISYGRDTDFVGEHKTFKAWVLAQQPYDLSRFHFLGTLPQAELAAVLASSDLHIYLTVPFVLSWSMMNAMSCGAVVLGSSTSPVREMIREGETGLLADFYKPEEFAAKALGALKDPDQYRPLGRAAEKLVAEKYSLEVILPQMIKLYEDAANQSGLGGNIPSPAPITLEDASDLFTTARPKSRSPFRG
ncbi:MAG: glycosyltransferase [Planctomycetota bacterium]|nr:glycosyltransferase [Planctomycetota bacterium]